MDATPSKLSRIAAELLRADGTVRFLGHASVREMGIKCASGKLGLKTSPRTMVVSYVRRGLLQLTPIRLEHTLMGPALPLHHRDSFDRLIIAQALTENIPVVSNDPMFEKYGVTRIWD